MPAGRRFIPAGFVEYEAAGIVRVLADVERRAAVFQLARAVGMAVDQLSERLDLVGLGPELDDDHIGHGDASTGEDVL